LKNSTSESVERLKIARDLHDTLAQEIAAVGFTCDEAIALSPMGSSRNSLVEIRARLSLLSTILRDEIALLRDDQRNLAQLLHDFVTEISATSAITIKVHNLNYFEKTTFAANSTIEIFRAVREILSNIVLHSGATAITISAFLHENTYELSIIDDGDEFDFSQIAHRRPHHFGSLGIRERLESIGSTLQYSRSKSSNIWQIKLTP